MVNRIDLEWWGEEQDTELAAVLQACDGVEELVLTYVERVHLEQVATGPSASSLLSLSPGARTPLTQVSLA